MKRGWLENVDGPLTAVAIWHRKFERDRTVTLLTGENKCQASSVFAIHALAAFVPLLGFDRQRCDRPRIKAL